MIDPASYRAGLEAAARLAEAHGWQDHKNKRRVSSYNVGARDCATLLADAIRSLPVPAADDEAVVERVARAICVSNGSDPDETCRDVRRWRGWHRYAGDARAALAAMREGKP